MPLFIVNQNAKIAAECQWRLRMNKGHGSHCVHGGQHALRPSEAARRNKLWHRFENISHPLFMLDRLAFGLVQLNFIQQELFGFIVKDNLLHQN